METYIALLRGINVSGQKMIKMADLVELLSELKLKNIRTYIQSGNVVFENTKTDPKKLASKIKEKILEYYGFDVPVIIRSQAELLTILKKNPFLGKRKEDTEKFYVAFLSEEPESENIKKMEILRNTPEEWVVSGKEIYLFYSSGYGKSKLTNNVFESKLKVIATTRNWNTVNTLSTL